MSLTRTHTCGELNASHVGEQIILNGWVATRRDLGGVVFIDLRDRHGITQIIFTEEEKELHAQAEHLRSEFTVGILGMVRERGQETKNAKMSTGEIEVVAESLVVYSKSQTPPFEIKDGIATNEEIRLKYRYLDLRRPELQANLVLRSKLYKTVRNYYYDHDFNEVETPVLMKSTPEGARDYLVPSRVNAGRFYALPQSPQTYKQLLMVAGMDRYFQIVKCFRDEDLRADRQPEFTQIDVEMSFINEEDIYASTEGLMKEIFTTTHGYEIPAKFDRVTYDEAIRRFGSDKPDTRFGMEICDFTDIVASAEFRVFNSVATSGGAIVGINVTGGNEAIGRGAIDRLTDRVRKETGAGGLIYIRVDKDGAKSSVDKFVNAEMVQAMADRIGAKDGDLVLILAGKQPDVFTQCGDLRLMMAKEFNLIKEKQWNFLWVTEFPLVEWDEDSQRYHALHHPFTSPKPEHIGLMKTDPAKIKARAYDLVLNGNEIGGGSIRIHDTETQQNMFELLGIKEDEAQEKFGFLLEAFTFGPPPHGGIAMGLDRIAMLLTGATSLRDVIAFPKNQKAQSPMDGSPGMVETNQLDDLHIKLKPIVKEL